MMDHSANNQPDSRFRIYKSSAGSGKTYTLVKEYLALVLRHPESYTSVLAVTFTNKAAKEMKERIIKALSEIIRGENPDLKNQLAEQTGLSAIDVPIRCKRVLSYILHNYSRFAVSTIDSFTNRIVRTFGQDLGVSSGFEIESDTDSVKEMVVDQLMDNIGRDEYVTNVLLEFTTNQIELEKDWRIEKQLSDVASSLFQDTADESIQKLASNDRGDFLALIEKLKSLMRDFEKEINEAAERIVMIIESAGYDINDFPYKSSGYAGIAYKLSANSDFQTIKSNYFKKDDGKLTRFGSVVELDQENLWVSKSSKDFNGILQLLDDGLREEFRKLYDIYLEGYSRYVTAAKVFEKAYGTAVLSEMEQLIETYKEEENRLLFADLNRKISGFIENEPPDYIFWRLGEKYQHYLLDEFQDTSRIQWKNFKPLFEHVLSGGAPDGTVLLVGDTKQAIYRWRGGESSLMETEAPAFFGVDALRLETNYRSQAGIVSFNNLFFGRIPELYVEHPLIPSIYDKPEQEIAPKHDSGGYVRVNFLDTGRGGLKNFTPEMVPPLVQEIIEDGFRYKDIGILIRKGDLGREIATLLNKAGIPVISNDSLLIQSHPYIGFLISLLRSLANPRDELARIESLSFWLAQKFPDQKEKIQVELLDLSDAENQQQHFLAKMPSEFAFLAQNLSGLPLYELTESLIRIFGLEKDGGAYLQKFLEEILQFSERKGPDVSGFLEHWEDTKEKISISVPDTENAVRIMTIHKAKGLEFPVVILPVTDWTLTPHANTQFWADAPEEWSELSSVFLLNAVKDLQNTDFAPALNEEINQNSLEALNMLYVAFTRPRERMYVFARSKGAANKDFKFADQIIHEILSGDQFEWKDNVVEWGTPEPPVQEKEETQPLLGTELLSSDWKERIVVRPGYLDLWNEKDESKREGLPINALLRMVLLDAQSFDDFENVLTKMKYEGLVGEDNQKILQSQLRKLLEIPQLKSWFDPGKTYRRKPEWVMKNSNRRAADRMVMDGDEIDLILFNTEINVESQISELKRLIDKLNGQSSKHYKAFILKIASMEILEV